MATQKDYVLSLNEFNVPKELKDRDAMNIRLLRLLLLEKGKYPDQPDMGIDIVGQWRYMKDDEVYKLIDAIKDQIDQYLPDLVGADVECSVKNNILFINITTVDLIFEYKVDNYNVTDLTRSDLDRITTI